MTDQERVLLLLEVQKMKEEMKTARENCYIGAGFCFVIAMMGLIMMLAEKTQ